MSLGLVPFRRSCLSKCLLDFLTNRFESAAWIIQNTNHIIPKLNRKEIGTEG